MNGFVSRSVILILALCLFLSAGAAEHPGSEAFITATAKEHGLDEQFIRELLAEAEYRQDIIDAITRPAEAKPWHQYRNIFLTERRIKGGALFLGGHWDLLQNIEAEFGVPAEIVAAITGVETSYGGNTGSYRVIDALVTLGFYYPRRSDFFSAELAHLFKLAHEESLPLIDLRGSYAGAMGLGQFMPSSYRAYAVDFDDDGRRDLWQSLEDALGSVANYLKSHRWQAGEPVVLPATVDNPNALPEKPALKLEYTLAELAAMGVRPLYGELDPATPAMLVRLEREDGTEEFWIGLNNFYAITRYNRSALYAMAVYQLSQAITELVPEQLNAEAAE
ncbi:MAG: lytic murein transglycosylase B [Wenzhouxiangellaceae bacterium]